MLGAKCGCPYCDRRTIIFTRGGWLSRKNKKGLTYGQTKHIKKGIGKLGRSH